MRKPTFCRSENKGADQLRSNFQPLAIFCACTAKFVSDLLENHDVGFLMMRLILAIPTDGM